MVMSAAQIGKTDAFILNVLAYYMDYAPAPIMCMQPTLDMGQTLSKDRISPMLRDTPRLKGLVDVKSRFAGNTVMKKNFIGGHITIVGANSPSSLASRPIKVLLADEIDRYPKSAGTEGDPLNLAKKRQTTFWDCKTVMVSTPTIKGDSRIEDAFNLSTQEEWNIPCPECGAYQPLVWENVKFDPDNLEKGIDYVCRECGCVANEYRWKAQEIKGKYVAANPGAATRGFHLNTLASTFVGWDEVVRKFLEAKEALDHGNPEEMKVWVNTELGQTWEERGIQLEDTELYNRRSGHKKLRQIFEKARSSRHSFALAIGDIDFFKKVNDTYGHECGDAVLKNVSALLKQHMWRRGFAARWGGEEFLLVFENVDLTEARKQLELLMDKIHELDTLYEGQHVKVTMTFGLVCESDKDLHTILKEADEKLYIGKTNGRNQVVS